MDGFDLSTISKIYIGGTEYSAIYIGDTLVWSAGSSGPCFAVVNDISQYTDTSFVDVYNKADSKWYKLNNLNQYEPYGIYETTNDLTSVTYYTNKLVVLTTDSHEYKWNGTSWIDCGFVEIISDVLPTGNIFNYNAKRYNSTTGVITNDSDDSNMPDVIVTGNTPTVNTNYLTIPIGTYAIISGIQSYLQRSNNSPNLTIISRAKTTAGCNIFANRDSRSGYNYMYRQYNSKLTLHGNSEQGSIATSSSEPSVLSIKIDSNRLLEYHNWTRNTTSTQYNFNYGGTNIYDAVLFRGYSDTSDESWGGDFYWISLYTSTLTDEQIQQVIDFNEGEGGQTVYPIEYDEKVAPPNYVHYDTLEELELAECPWVGMHAFVGNVVYVYTDNGWEMEQQHDYSLDYLTFEAIEDSQFSFGRNSLYYSLDYGLSWTLINNNTNTPTVTAGNTILWKQTGNESGIDKGLVGSFKSTGKFNAYGNMLSILWGDDFREHNRLNTNGDFTRLFLDCTNLISAENLIFGVDEITVTYAYQAMFKGCSNLIKAPKELPATVVAGQSYEEMFSNCTSLIDGPVVKALSLISYCCSGMFKGCSSLTSMTFYCTSKNTQSTYYGFSQGVSGSGTFYAKTPSIWQTGTNGIPYGWTAVQITD